jgi:hypothetical protein
MKKAATKDAELVLERKISRYLSLYQGKTTRERVLELLSDLTGEAESVWDYNSIRFEAVMTAKEWNSFVRHKDRKPYKSKIQPDKMFHEKRRVYLDLIKEIYDYYSMLPSSGYKETLKSSLGGLIDCFLNAFYEIQSMRFFDLYMGRRAMDRDNGKVNPTKISLVKLEYAISEYAYLSGRNAAELRKKIMNICDGRINVLFDYYATCDMEEGFRYDLKEVLKNLQRDYTLAFFDLKIGWEIWKIINWIGLDVDKYFELSGFPKFALIEKRLLNFMTNEKYTKEILEHMKDELPECYEKYKRTGQVTSDEIIHEEARRKKYPKKLPSTKEVNKLIKLAHAEVFKYFPLAKNGSTKNIILNPIHPESTDRAFQSSTRNIAGERVNVIVMTPRSESKDTYIPTLAHETTHLMHRLIVELGERKGILRKGSSDMLPGNIMEYFSALVEDQFARNQKLPYKKKYEGKEFSDFKSATTTRFQVPYTLVQLGIRKRFDEYIRAGYKELSEDMLYDLKLEFDRKARKWASMGINVDYERLSAFKIFKSNDPEDGLVYMKKYIENDVQNNNHSGKKVMDMMQAFKKRFGINWLKDKQARTLLLWMFLESGRNYKSEDYGSIILKKSIHECSKELVAVGVSSEKV